MTSSTDLFPDRREPVLPSRDTGIAGLPVLDKEHPAQEAAAADVPVRLL
jgi:hypothetical protein